MIPFVRDMTFQYGVADQVSPLIRRVVANNPGPFTYLGTGTYIVGRGEVAVIDPGPMMDDHLDAILHATKGERITAILTTHTHIDHSPLAHPLQDRSGAPIYGLAAPEAPSGFEEANEARFKPDVEIADGALISGPLSGPISGLAVSVAGPSEPARAGDRQWTLEAIATPGHASNHVCYALAEESALFCGDHVMGWSTTVISPPDGDMGDYYASLDKIEARSFSVLWPTHGPPITAPAPFLDAYRRHRLDRERQILGALAAGQERIKAMVPSLYAAVDPRLHPAAAHSVLAHLIHLVRTGAVTCDGEPSIDSVYRLSD